MLEIIESGTFKAWFATLRDRQAKARIDACIRRLGLGNPGQYRVLKGKVCEMKIDYGRGYRIYYTMRNNVIVVLLCGGDKTTQQSDIEIAMHIAKQWKS
ncbi:MAG: type II toxin-antitoxin system RelE/ParE family toxin [Rudaea sp.]